MMFVQMLGYSECITISTPGGLEKYARGHGGNRNYDLWNTSPMLCQLSWQSIDIFHLARKNSQRLRMLRA